MKKENPSQPANTRVSVSIYSDRYGMQGRTCVGQKSDILINLDVADE